MPPRRQTLDQRLAARVKGPRTRAPKGTGSVWLSVSGRYLGEWTDPETKVKHRPTGTSAAIVWAKIDRLKRGESANGTHSADPLLTDYCAEWIDLGVGARGRPVRDSYSIKLEETLRLHVAPVFAGVRVKEVTPKMVRDFLIAKRKEGYGPGSISGMRNLLSGALGAARLEDIIVSNPALGHQIGSAPSGFMVPGASADMAKRVIEAVDKTRFDDLISILVYLPARSGEIVRLDWSLVHFDTRMVTVLRTETRVKAPVGSGLRSVRGSGDTKTSAGRRTIPIPEEALMRLQERHWQAGMPAFGLVFPSMTNPLVPVSPRWVLKEFQALMAAATPPIPLTKIHQLRHLGISLLISAGVPLPVVSKIAGHADPSITAKLYAHVMGDAEQQAIEHLRFQPLRLLDGIPVSEWEIDPESTL